MAITSDPTLTGPITEGTSISLTCTMEMGALQLVESDWRLFDLEVSLSRDDSEITFINSTTLPYTHWIVSFNRSDSGNYSCTATARPQPSSVFINGSDAVSDVLKVTTGKVKCIMNNMVLVVNFVGVYLKLRSRIYINNSMIPISEIGEGEDALLCFTDLRECCRSNQTLNKKVLGDWLYPNGSGVGTLKSYPDEGFYKNRNHSVVRLHRGENITMPTGQFCCKVPDATHQMVTVCINVNNYNCSPPLTCYGDEQISVNPLTSTTPLTPEG